ncbi:EF-hand domain-containing protein [Rhodovibrio salinarum]|uniref:EF-hand domain-containing protein n=1 Tax=Rhodovibrio salinarum TaxID=1087 RepID=A0A934QLS9_9PROT|nr:EF-hand domain-containing protein [Rhodovibrio salinarum]MBK1699032.1 hypothetical protein [Rhodovibrio salinarum]
MTRKTKWLTSTFALAVAVGAAGVALQAQAAMPAFGRPSVPPFFAAADANDDGAVTRDELHAFVQEQLTAMDADGDGIVSEDEFEDGLDDRRQAMAQARFDQLDKNGDGALSPDEFDQARAAPAMQRSRPNDDRRAEFLFRRLDANDDEVLQAIEVTSFADRVFARADANGDGQVSEAELQDMRPDRSSWRDGPRGSRFDGHKRGGCR